MHTACHYLSFLEPQLLPKLHYQKYVHKRTPKVDIEGKSIRAIPGNELKHTGRYDSVVTADDPAQI